MKIRKGYKYRLKTNRRITQQLAQFSGACRFVRNKILALNDARYRARVPRLSYNAAAGLLTLWKQSEAYGFLRDVHSQVLQQCLQDLDRAQQALGRKVTFSQNWKKAKARLTYIHTTIAHCLLPGLLPKGLPVGRQTHTRRVCQESPSFRAGSCQRV